MYCDPCHPHSLLTMHVFGSGGVGGLEDLRESPCGLASGGQGGSSNMRRGTRSIFHTMGSHFQIEPNLLSALFLPKILMSQNGPVCHNAGERDEAGQGE